jgi:hypothetical protein
MGSGLKVGPKKHKLMFATEEMVAEPLAVKACWWVWALCRDDRNGVDAKDLCSSPCQCCLDGFQFVNRVGFNRGGDAVFARYILGHLPCPPNLTPNQIGRRWCGGSTWGSTPSTLQPTALRGLGWAPQSPAMKYIIVAERWQRKCGHRRPGRPLFKQGLAMLVFEHPDVVGRSVEKSAAPRAQQLRSKLCARDRGLREDDARYLGYLVSRAVTALFILGVSLFVFIVATSEHF